jgi:hypothetical protein
MHYFRDLGKKILKIYCHKQIFMIIQAHRFPVNQTIGKPLVRQLAASISAMPTRPLTPWQQHAKAASSLALDIASGTQMLFPAPNNGG